jgi:hypothetical protein
MIKLNAQGEQAPTMRTVQQNGEPVSFVDKLSALAQKAMSRLAGSSYAGGSFSRITKMIPAVMLAVFAFTTASAQLYTNSFENTTGTSGVNIQTPPGAISGGTRTNSYGDCGGSWAYWNVANSTSYSYSVTITAQSGYQFTISGILAEMRKRGTGGGNGTVVVTVTGAHGANPLATQTSSSSNITSTTCDDFDYTSINSTVLYTTATITWSGTKPNNSVGGGQNGIGIDDIRIDGVTSLIPVGQNCTNPSAFNINLPGGDCGPQSITVTNSQNNVSYQLYRDATAFGGTNTIYGTPLAGNGGTITWSSLPEGTYTAVATATQGIGTCQTTASNNQTIKINPASFTTGGGGHVCSSTPVNITLSGSQVGMTYSLLRNGNAMTPAVNIAGNGSALSHPVTLDGTYTWSVASTATNCAATMTGNATVTAGNPAVTSLSVNGPVCFGNPDDIQPSFSISGTPNATVTYTVAGHSTGAQNGSNKTVTLNGAGNATITLTNSTADVTVTLNSIAINGCDVPLTNTATFDVAADLTATITGNDSACVGSAYPTNTVIIAVTGTNPYTRTVSWETSTDGITWTAQTDVVFAGGTSTLTASRTLFTSGTQAAYGVTYYARLTGVAYSSNGLTCAKSLSTTVTKKPKTTANFDFGVIVDNGSYRNLNAVDTICMPVNTVDFRITNLTNATGSNVTYTITKTNGAAFSASGNFTGNQSSIISGVTSPAGTYTVNITNTNGCVATKVFNVAEVNKPTFTYTLNNQVMNAGDTVEICGAQNFTGVVSSSVVRQATVDEIFNSNTSTSLLTLSAGLYRKTNNYTSPDVTSATVYPVHVTVRNYPLQTAGCDSSIVVYLKVNPRPQMNGTGVVKVNGGNISKGGTAVLCENTTANITVAGVPGHAVEIHYVYGPYSVSNTFPASGYTQVPTGVIGANGTYTYTFPTGAYNRATDSSSQYRTFYRIEVKDPVTLCADTFTLRTRVSQKPRINITYQKTEPNITNGATSLSTAVPVPVGSTIYHCFPGEFRLNFVRDNSNTHWSTGTSNANNISYNLIRNSTSASVHTGHSIAGVNTPDGFQITLTNDNIEGSYTLYATNDQTGCDSLYTFNVVTNPAPVYSTTGMSATSICEEDVHNVTVTGNLGQTQVYSLRRIGGTGVVPTGVQTTWTGALTAGTTSINIAGLLAQAGNANATGTHIFRLMVGSPDSLACPKLDTFTLTVVKKPIVTLEANDVVVAPGDTLTHCAGETVHYTLIGIPVGTPYRMYRTGVVNPIAQGISSSVEQSVITLVQQQAIAGTYTIRLDNGNCDSAYSFQVVVNNAPALTYISHTADLNCYGASNGTVTYSYTANNSGTSFYTYIVDLNAADTVQIHNSNLLSQPYVQHGNLVAGDYRLILTTGNGCVSSFDFEIAQPSQINLTINGTQSACNAANGSVTFSVEGGTPGYDVVITNNTTNQVSTTFSQAAAFGPYTVSNLATGTYTVTVTDDNGCVATAAFTVNSCSAADLVPVASFTGTSNYSLANTTALPMTLEIWNLGQVASNGQIQIALMLPPNFTISSTGLSAGWTVSTSGLYTMLTSNTAVVGANAAAPVTVNANLVLNGSTSTGINALLVQLPPGTGGDAVNTNNTTNVILNVVN